MVDEALSSSIATAPNRFLSTNHRNCVVVVVIVVAPGNPPYSGTMCTVERWPECCVGRCIGHVQHTLEREPRYCQETIRTRDERGTTGHSTYRMFESVTD